MFSRLARIALVVAAIAAAPSSGAADPPDGFGPEDRPRPPRRGRPPASAPADFAGDEDWLPPMPGDAELERGPGPGREGDRPGRQMIERLERLMKFAQEHFPEEAEQMRRLRRDDPAAFRERMRRTGPRLARFMEAYERDPQGIGRLMIEDHKLTQQIHDRARQVREAADEPTRARLSEALRERLARQWDVRMERRRLEIADLEKRLAEQRRRLEERETRRQQMIDEQFEEVTGRSEPW